MVLALSLDLLFIHIKQDRKTVEPQPSIFSVSFPPMQLHCPVRGGGRDGGRVVSPVPGDGSALQGVGGEQGQDGKRGAQHPQHTGITG